MRRTAFFGVSKEDGTLIARIADRAIDLMYERLGNPDAARFYIERDLTSCVASGCPLRLKTLFDANDADFLECINGIGTHIDRYTGEVGTPFDDFRPKFAVLQ